MSVFISPSLRLASRLREALRARAPLIGTFIKSSPAQNIELLGGTGIDFVVVDLEHAPIDLSALDEAARASIAADLPLVARLPQAGPHLIGAALDLGAAGVMLAHVSDEAAALDFARRGRFRGGSRGASPSVRAAGFGRMSLDGFIETSDQSVSLWAQIEDIGAVDTCNLIAQVPGIDCVFAGRMDLAAQLGVQSINAPAIARAAQNILAASVQAGISGAVHASAVEDALLQRASGANVLVVSSDQALLRAGMCATVNALKP